MASIHDKLERVRKPRVHIKYDVETEGAMIERELPFVVGVMGDFSADSEKPKKTLKDRKFTQIDRDNFNEVMANVEPGLKFRVANSLSDKDEEIAVDLKFTTMESFEPAQVLQQIEPLRVLFEARNELSLLLSKADRSEELETMLEEVLQNNAALQQMAKELNINAKNTSSKGTD